MWQAAHRTLAAAAVPTFALQLGLGLPARADPSWPSHVTAVYKVEFGGFEIGHFKFESAMSGPGYTLNGQAQLSAMLGAFKWVGTTRSSGQVTSDQPRPAAYTFDFKSTTKSGSVAMGFSHAAVTNVTMVPPNPPSPHSIPVQPHHLKDVLDPLSAVMALTRTRGANPCGRRLAIYDGKVRFDLQFSFRRQIRINEARPSGQPGIAYVCQVRYVPVAGHKDNESTRNLASNNGIEVALRPVPSANLAVPYQVSVQTFGGTAVLTAQRVEIVTSSNGRIALVH
jgi:hypothetical protein